MEGGIAVSDFYAILKVQNGRIRRAMEEAGVSSVAELARLAGYKHPTQVYELVNFKSAARLPTGKWSACAKRVADALGVLPDELFPDHLCVTMESNQIAKYVERDALPSAGYRHLPSPVESAIDAELKDRIERLLSTLSTREAAIIRLRYALEGEREHTFKECAERVGVTRERVRQIEAEALRKLQRPVRAKWIEGFVRREV